MGRTKKRRQETYIRYPDLLFFFAVLPHSSIRRSKKVEVERWKIREKSDQGIRKGQQGLFPCPLNLPRISYGTSASYPWVVEPADIKTRGA